jgi:hypothetical protein
VEGKAKATERFDGKDMVEEGCDEHAMGLGVVEKLSSDDVFQLMQG